MRPTPFVEANSLLRGGPASVYGIEVEDLQTFRDHGDLVSCWTPTWKERISLLFGGKVWLHFFGATTHPPVAVTGAKTIFQRKEAL